MILKLSTYEVLVILKSLGILEIPYDTPPHRNPTDEREITALLRAARASLIARELAFVAVDNPPIGLRLDLSLQGLMALLAAPDVRVVCTSRTSEDYTVTNWCIANFLACKTWVDEEDIHHFELIDEADSNLLTHRIVHEIANASRIETGVSLQHGELVMVSSDQVEQVNKLLSGQSIESDLELVETGLQRAGMRSGDIASFCRTLARPEALCGIAAIGAQGAENAFGLFCATNGGETWAIQQAVTSARATLARMSNEKLIAYLSGAIRAIWPANNSGAGNPS